LTPLFVDEPFFAGPFRVGSCGGSPSPIFLRSGELVRSFFIFTPCDDDPPRDCSLLGNQLSERGLLCVLLPRRPAKFPPIPNQKPNILPRLALAFFSPASSNDLTFGVFVFFPSLMGTGWLFYSFFLRFFPLPLFSLFERIPFSTSSVFNRPFPSPDGFPLTYLRVFFQRGRGFPCGGSAQYFLGRSSF